MCSFFVCFLLGALIEQCGEGVVAHVAGMQQEPEALGATVAPSRAHAELLRQRRGRHAGRACHRIKAGDTRELPRAALDEVETSQAKYVLPLFFKFFNTIHKGGNNIFGKMLKYFHFDIYLLPVRNSSRNFCGP